MTYQGRVIRVEGVWDTPNGGVLCSQGRFDVLDDLPPRLTRPIIRRDGQTKEVSWDEALTYAAQGLKAAKTVAGMITPRSTNQCLTAFMNLFHDVLRSDQVGLLSGRVPPLGVGPSATMADLLASDCIVVIGGNPLKNQPVIGYLVRRAVDLGASLIVASAEETGLDAIADLNVRLQSADAAAAAAAAAGVAAAASTAAFHRIYHLRPDPLAQVKKQIESSQHPVLLYGGDLGEEIYAAMRTLPGKARFIPLVEGANAVGATRIGLCVAPVKGDALYVVARRTNEPRTARCRRRSSPWCRVLIGAAGPSRPTWRCPRRSGSRKPGTLPTSLANG